MNRFLIVLLVQCTGCFTVNSSGLAHRNVSPEQAKAIIDLNDGVVVVDVREADEYCSAGGHIRGALNYPWTSGVFKARFEELRPDNHILLVCRSGNRSSQAAMFLDSKGFSLVSEMVGGMRAWQWETVGCIDSDSDGINDDLDN